VGDKQLIVVGDKDYVRFGLRQGIQLFAFGDSTASPVWNLELATVVEHEARVGVMGSSLPLGGRRWDMVWFGLQHGLREGYRGEARYSQEGSSLWPDTGRCCCRWMVFWRQAAGA
jgi:hypothetical protein